jgi:hypothetical protein
MDVFSKLIRRDTMRIARLFIGIALMFTAVNAAAKQDKVLLCHVGNETGPGGEVYLDDPDCVPNDLNNYFCPDAGKIDLIVVAKPAKHLNNPSHTWDGISDYEPSEIGATGEGTEDSDGNGIDDGCEIPAGDCPCWATLELNAVTEANQDPSFSCDVGSIPPYLVVLQNTLIFSPIVEGGFLAEVDPPNILNCFTRDFPESSQENLTLEQASYCYQQIVDRCAAIGSPIIEN